MPSFKTVSETADALMDAIVSTSVSSLETVYSPDVVVWHNTDGREVGRDEVVAGVLAMNEALKVVVDVTSRELTDTGFVQTQHWTFTPDSGAPLEATSVFWVTVDSEGRVSRLDEYIDSAALEGLTRMVEAAGGTKGEVLHARSTEVTNEQLIRDLFVATDTFDVENVLPFLDEDVWFKFGNAEPLTSRQQFKDMVIEFNASVAGIRHELVDLWTPAEDVVVTVLAVHYSRLDGSQVTLPCVDVFRIRNAAITRYEIFMDINPVFATDN
jgi:ketosteroid isomerase-like protein